MSWQPGAGSGTAMEERPRAPGSILRALGPFSRVFAAGAVASAHSEVLAEDQKLPTSYAPEAQRLESGWDRLRELFARDERQRRSKELEDIYKAAITGCIIGWAYGGIPAFVHAKQRYIEQSQAEVYYNRFDAVQSAHRAATRGFIRYGWRWGWRTAVFVTIFNTVHTGLNVYRDKSALSHFIIAGAVSGSLFRINLGLTGFVAGGIIGALLGTPIGGLLMALQKYSGETIQERKQKDKKILQELKLEEWKARLQITELLPEEIESSLQKNQPKDDIEKIEALLNLPRNPSATDKQDKD
ncbi:complex I assembly factor TIMMDC1, mitochondrial isoform X1 [Pipistrellus kuhlii]|uniref:Complex I assembly factor TIMMDC1, mitochondrial n=1 Tax=Pipistrellus kuhlii TaxID=59472 RepID=A0A7J8ABL9_PIPKU|nr:complex I assembly factor TIMMDC1, mitochondrial isoform X1 [Pipistrellus kuhlii]KAF6383913.1 translocase of inner mitochondrial membrane domain containing 1 [Pipistrellus kuhlii]